MPPPPIKKRKGKKKKGKRRKKKKKTVEWLQFINEVPKYEDPDVVSPTVELIVTLIDNICPLHFERKIQLKTNRAAKDIRLVIEEMHQGAVGKIRMCRESFVPEDMLDENKSLHDNGITEPGTYRILYDYEPLSYPLLDY